MPPVQTVYDYIPLFKLFKWIARTFSRRARAKQLASGLKPKRKIYEDVVESYIPLEIILFLSK
jgi:putative membrane protein